MNGSRRGESVSGLMEEYLCVEDNSLVKACVIDQNFLEIVKDNTLDADFPIENYFRPGDWFIQRGTGTSSYIVPELFALHYRKME